VADHCPSLLLTRRETLTGALALAALPWGRLRAETTTELVVRRSVASPDLAPATLESFKRAIRAMLALPPSDPRNWYRQALVHLLDCPHANWWFLPWHRGYLVHFEATCRELSGDPAFALPFWDWTRSPRVPDALFDDVLSPTHALYEESFETFRPKFEMAIGDLWNGLTPAQRAQLDLRGFGSVADLWGKLESFFAARAEARGPTRENPELPDWAKTEVGEERVESALAPKRFEDFGSTASANHHQRAIQNTLESGPHNNIHNAVGGGPGFMSELLAPVDPIFWMHHANVDRLWDLWSRRERQAGRTALPEDAAGWRSEPFLFFPGGDAQSELYLETSSLGYSYGQGFGDAILEESHGAAAPATAPQDSGAATFEGEKVHAELRTDAEAAAAVRVPNTLLVAARIPKKKKRGGAHAAASVTEAHEGPELVAQISLNPPQNPRAVRVLFFMNCSYLSPETPVSDPHYVGSLTFFGVHGGHHRPAQVTATLPLNGTLQRIAATDQPVMNQVKLQGIATRDNGEHPTVDGALVQVTVKTV
jgi:tyrosinase